MTDSTMVDLSGHNSLVYADSYRHVGSAENQQLATANFGAQVFYFNFKFNVDANNGNLSAYVKNAETYTYLPSAAFLANILDNWTPAGMGGQVLRSNNFDASRYAKSTEWFDTVWAVNSATQKGGFVFDVNDAKRTVTPEEFTKFISYNVIVDTTKRFEYKMSSENNGAFRQFNPGGNSSGAKIPYQTVIDNWSTENRIQRLRLEPTHMKIMHFHNSGNSLIYDNPYGYGVIYRSMLSVNNSNLISDNQLYTGTTNLDTETVFRDSYNISTSTPDYGIPGKTTELWNSQNHLLGLLNRNNDDYFQNIGSHYTYLPYENNTQDIANTKNAFVKNIKFNVTAD
ncbi:hypothetical protein [Mycoplasmopsis columbinasalis]|uniref:Uncharacterized protein n=1 Tax=Mycoplasmopsis columbinasalis TaxID=114880 RepID=A0A449BAZ8_9BACT|nr:hypothetical protein [Mycoplasmopsis columbinasalis]VEU78360.1 Uncharacterised protein [Mycoplasmopsis columbinasalis]